MDVNGRAAIGARRKTRTPTSVLAALPGSHDAANCIPMTLKSHAKRTSTLRTTVAGAERSFNEARMPESAP